MNYYSSFSPSSLLISSSLSLESSPRISFGSVFSQNSWRQLYRSEQGIPFELHFWNIVLRSCLTCIYTQSVVVGELCCLLLQSRSGIHLKVYSTALVGLHGWCRPSFTHVTYLLALLDGTVAEEVTLLWEVVCPCWRLLVFHFYFSFARLSAFFKIRTTQLLHNK